MQRMSSFTLIEILVVVIVVAILAAIAIPIYNNTVEKVRADICTANTEALVAADDIYKMKYGVYPTQIAMLINDSGDEGLAVVWEMKKKRRDYLYLAYRSLEQVKYFIADIFSSGFAYAALRDEVADKRIFKCPSDNRLGVTFSYGMNTNVQGVASIADSTIVFADCDVAVLDANSPLYAYRHVINGQNRAILITHDRRVYDRDSSNDIWERTTGARRLPGTNDPRPTTEKRTSSYR